MKNTVNLLLRNQRRASTNSTYFRVWRQFNKFIINLDKRPDTWEERTILYIGYLVHNGMQFSMIKSYVSVIKKTLVDDGYDWNDEKVLLTSFTKGCRLVNDKVKTRLGITKGLLELLLFEIERVFWAKSQCYLEIMYKAMFALGYYGLMRIGKLTYSCHVVKAANVHIAKNKCKILVVLYSSKTHSEAVRPQKIRITKNGKLFT